MFIYSGLFYINKKEKNTFIHIKKGFLEMNSQQRVSLYISLRNEPSWNRKSVCELFYLWKDSFEGDISKIINIFICTRTWNRLKTG